MKYIVCNQLCVEVMTFVLKLIERPSYISKTVVTYIIDLVIIDLFAFEKQTQGKIGNPGISLVNSNKTMDYDQIFD